jgi:hypothetical protein
MNKGRIELSIEELKTIVNSLQLCLRELKDYDNTGDLGVENYAYSLYSKLNSLNFRIHKELKS